MDRSIAHAVTPDQLVPGVRDVVLVAVETLAVLLGPTRILVLLPVFRRFLCPLLRCSAGLHRLVLLFAVAVLRDRHDRGIDHLPAARDIAFGFKVVTETR